LRDSTGTLVASTSTDSSGNYFFGQLDAGQYQVVIPTPPTDAPLSSGPTSTTDDDVDSQLLNPRARLVRPARAATKMMQRVTAMAT